MDNDDQQIGHILSRREVLTLFGTAGIALLAACGPGQSATTQPTIATTQVPTTAATNAAQPTSGTGRNVEAATATLQRGNPTAVASQQGQVATAANTQVATTAASTRVAAAVPACVVRPEVTEGPYYVNEELDRADIRADPATGVVKEGAPLTLTFNVSQVATGSCTPLQGAKVEVWHCDAAGTYSDVTDRGVSTKGQRFLRGYQVTDTHGTAAFTTIYPGWYPGRAVHIHFKVSTTGNTVFTSQLFFDDALSDQVFAQAPYAGKGKRNMLNNQDGIYKDLLLLTTTKAGQGYAATFDFGIQKA